MGNSYSWCLVLILGPFVDCYPFWGGNTENFRKSIPTCDNWVKGCLRSVSRGAPDRSALGVHEVRTEKVKATAADGLGGRATGSVALTKARVWLNQNKMWCSPLRATPLARPWSSSAGSQTPSSSISKFTQWDCIACLRGMIFVGRQRTGQIILNVIAVALYHFGY